MGTPQTRFEDLSPAEQILHVQDLWDRIAARPEGIHLTDEQAVDLERRLVEHRADPTSGSSWDEVCARIRGPKS